MASKVTFGESLRVLIVISADVWLPTAEAVFATSVFEIYEFSLFVMGDLISFNFFSPIPKIFSDMLLLPAIAHAGHKTCKRWFTPLLLRLVYKLLLCVWFPAMSVHVLFILIAFQIYAKFINCFISNTIVSTLRMNC